MIPINNVIEYAKCEAHAVNADYSIYRVPSDFYGLLGTIQPYTVTPGEMLLAIVPSKRITKSSGQLELFLQRRLQVPRHAVQFFISNTDYVMGEKGTKWIDADITGVINAVFAPGVSVVDPGIPLFFTGFSFLLSSSVVLKDIENEKNTTNNPEANIPTEIGSREATSEQGG